MFGVGVVCLVQVQYARDSPLRPELVESTYHLYMATKDPHYLTVGKELLFSLQVRPSHAPSPKQHHPHQYHHIYTHRMPEPCPPLSWRPDPVCPLLSLCQNRTRVPCGFASIADVSTRRLDDRMDSFFLAETLKYLYLLFDNALEPDQQHSLFCPLGAPLTPTPAPHPARVGCRERRGRGRDGHDDGARGDDEYNDDVRCRRPHDGPCRRRS
jgi:hypothetical protein